MKIVLAVLSFFAFALLMLPGLVKPPADALATDKSQVQALAHALRTALMGYQEAHGQFPEGEQDRIMKELRGGNSKRIVFFECPREILNDHGEMIDPWGTPFRIGFDYARMIVKIHSAGPNRAFEGVSPMERMMSDDFHSGD